MRLVAEQARPVLGQFPRDRVARDVHRRELGARCGGERLGDLIPREHLVGRDLERLADRAVVAEQAHERDREVAGVRHRPQARAVALHHHLLSPAHAVDRRPAPEQRDARLVVGVRGTHDRHGESTLAIGRDEQLLARDLVARVLPERVAQRRRLGDGQAPDGLLVGGCARDVHVLARAALEQRDVAFDLLG